MDILIHLHAKIKEDPMKILFAALFFSVLSASESITQGQSTNADFQQALAEYHQSSGPANLAAAEKVIKLAVAMDQMPPIPEEARKHFLIGNALFKDAKTLDDYTQVINEFNQAISNAPWWPEARYNRALAFEADGKYADAVEQLKLYQLFKLPDDEARTVQDKIYVLGAKQEKAAKESQVIEDLKMKIAGVKFRLPQEVSVNPDFPHGPELREVCRLWISDNKIFIESKCSYVSPDQLGYDEMMRSLNQWREEVPTDTLQWKGLKFSTKQGKWGEEITGNISEDGNTITVRGIPDNSRDYIYERE